MLQISALLSLERGVHDSTVLGLRSAVRSMPLLLHSRGRLPVPLERGVVDFQYYSTVLLSSAVPQTKRHGRLRTPVQIEHYGTSKSLCMCRRRQERKTKLHFFSCDWARFKICGVLSRSLHAVQEDMRVRCSRTNHSTQYLMLNVNAVVLCVQDSYPLSYLILCREHVEIEHDIFSSEQNK